MAVANPFSSYSQLPKRLESLELSASCVPGNLAVLYDSTRECCGYAVAHSSKVVIIRWEHGTSSKQTVLEPFPSATEVDSLTFITGVKWCELLSGLMVLVITSFAGFVIMNDDGTKRLFQYRMTHKENSLISTCARGIASIGNCLCVGTSEGSILVFSVKIDEGVEFRQQLTKHEYSIACLAANEDGYLASGDEQGCVVIWRDPTASRTQDVIAEIIKDEDASCTQLCWWHNLVVIGYGNGKVRICNNKGLELVEVHAHSRWISGLDIASETGLMLTLSEDSTFSVWKLLGSKQPKLSLVHSGVVENALLTGGMFCDMLGNIFALTSYDSNIIMEFCRS